MSHGLACSLRRRPLGSKNTILGEAPPAEGVIALEMLDAPHKTKVLRRSSLVGKGWRRALWCDAYNRDFYLFFRALRLS